MPYVVPPIEYQRPTPAPADPFGNPDEIADVLGQILNQSEAPDA